MALNDPMGDILQNVMGVASYIQNAKIQREAMLRQRETDAHNEAVRKVEFLNSGDPVGVDGTISRMVQAPDTSTFTMGPDGMPRATGGMNPLATRLPVDPARTVAYKGSTVYVPTQREQADQQLQTVLDRTRAVEGIQTAGAVDRFRQQHALAEEERTRRLATEGIDIPIPGQGTRRALPEHATGLANVVKALSPDEDKNAANIKAAKAALPGIFKEIEGLGLPAAQTMRLKAGAASSANVGDLHGAASVVRDFVKGQDTKENRIVIQNNGAAIKQRKVDLPGVNEDDIQGLTGTDLLQRLPAGVANDIKAMAEGRSAAPSPNSRAAGAQAKRNLLLQYDPTWSEQRAQVRKAFTTGEEGQNIGALNTAITHLGRLGDAAEALKNGSFTPANEAYNYLRDKFGDKAVTNFGLLKDAVAGEMAAALKGNATDVEIEKMGKSIRSSNSPDQMRGIITEGMQILGDKAGTYHDRYQRENPGDSWSPILPTAKAQMDRFAKPHGGGGTGGPKVGDVKNHQGHNYKFDGKQWVKQ